MTVPLDAMNDLSDDALLVRYANGDSEAARALTARLTPRVFGHAYRLLGNRPDAEDVTQEAMMRLWKIAPEWRQGEAQVSTWLYRVTANLCIDRVRRKPAQSLDSIPDPEDGAQSVAEMLQNKARVDALHAALGALPDRQRQAVVLRHLEGLGNPEIARIMNIGPRAVESLIARGKRALAVVLAGRRKDLGYTDD